MLHPYVMGLIGGLMIGLAAAILLIFRGRIMGASGILAGTMVPGGAFASNLVFTLGLIAAPALAVMLMGGAQTNITTSLPLIIAGGLLVGFGTRLGAGCTSGHGVCGMSRLSLRSIISTLIYIGAGVAIIPIARALGVL